MRSVPKISVCIPTYNRAAYLTQCLSSILGQTFSNFELIVSDNCSTDTTKDVVESLGDPRVRYFRNESNLGAVRNVNRCFELAEGEYVCILHDDDLYAPSFLECETEMLDRHPTAGFVHCAAYEIDGDGVRRRLVRAYPKDGLMEGKQEFVRYLGGHNVCCSTVMARRDLYRQVEPFDTTLLCPDWLMWLRLALLADVAYIAEPLAAMRVHAATLSSSIEPSRWCAEFLDIVERGFSLAEATYPSLLRSRKRVLRRAVRAQGNRFFIAAVSAMTAESFSLADGYVDVLRQLEGRGLPRAYGVLASALRNRAGRRLLSLARRLRRAREAKNLPAEAAW